MESKEKSKKIYEQVLDYINNMIIEGVLSKGDKLPTERMLAKKLEVSRTSIREAIKTLEVIGLVDRRQGDGTFIKENFDYCLVEPLSIVFTLEQSKKAEVFEARNMIEIEAVSLAAKRITDEEIEYLDKLFQRMKREDDEIINAKLDKEFHYRIAKASKNIIILNFYNVMYSLLEFFIKDIRRRVIEEESKREIVIDLHENILLSLKNRDSKKAADAMKAHMAVINLYYNKKYK